MNTSFISLFFITLLCSFNIWLALRINENTEECTDDPTKYKNFSFALLIISGIIPLVFLISMYLKPTGPVVTGLLSILSMVGVFFYNDLLTACEVEDKNKEIAGMAIGLGTMFVISVVIYNRMVAQAKEIVA